MGEEGSSSPKFSLAHFPCEVLSNLTMYLGGGDILSLWKSGNVRLRALLTLQGGVRQFRLITDARTNIVIPAFLYELAHLEHLSIRIILHEYIEWTGLDLFKLPRSLKSLDLVGEDLLPLFQRQTTPDTAASDLIPLASYFTSLETLSLHGNLAKFCGKEQILYCPTLTRLRLTTSRITYADLSRCPQSLTELYVDDIHHSHTTESTKLPPNLIRLRAPLYIGHDPLVLPLGLEYLDCVISAKQKGTSLPKWPEALKSLVLVLNLYTRFSEDSARHFPPHLTYLNLQYAEEMPSSNFKLLEALPLKRLVMPAGTHLKDDLVRYLPRTLVRLDAEYQSDLTEALVEHLPPRLTELWISLVNLERDESVARLPRSLIRLSMLSCSFSQVEHLPQQLKVLKLTNARFVHQKRVAKLPPDLKTFSCDMMTEFHPACLPSSITDLDIAADDIDDASAAHYPPQLTFLSLRGGAISNSFLANLNTPSLTNFSYVSATTTQHQLTDQGLALLPPTLKRLHLNSRTITSACASLLPRALTELKLDQSREWKDQDVQHLPRGLKELYIPECTSLTHECIAFLPPQLLRLSMNGYPGFHQIYNDLSTTPEIWH